MSVAVFHCLQESTDAVSQSVQVHRRFPLSEAKYICEQLLKLKHLERKQTRIELVNKLGSDN